MWIWPISTTKNDKYQVCMSIYGNYRVLQLNRMNRQLSVNHNGPLAKPLLRGATVSFFKCIEKIIKKYPVPDSS